MNTGGDVSAEFLFLARERVHYSGTAVIPLKIAGVSG